MAKHTAEVECIEAKTCTYAIVHHTQMHFNLHTQRKPTAFKQTFIQHVHSILIDSKLELQR